MIVVDSSVWIAALRSASSREARVLGQLLDADEVALPIAVRIELLSGASRTDRPSLRRGLSALPLLYPSDDTWAIVERWLEAAGDAGARFGMGDLLIAALAEESRSLVWSLDSDFERMQRAGFVRTYEP